MAQRVSFIRRITHACAVATGGALLSVAIFLLLPLVQSMTQASAADTLLRSADTAELPPPPEVPEMEEPEPEKAEEEPKPELAEQEAPPIDLGALESLINPGAGGDGWGNAGELSIRLPGAAGAAQSVDELISVEDLDQKPRVIYQASPALDAKLRKHCPGTVYVIFIVDTNGRVDSPLVQKSTDPALERAAVTAVKQWKFEPGMRKGQPVRFRMRVPIVFPSP
jgi:protein TonB